MDVEGRIQYGFYTEDARSLSDVVNQLSVPRAVTIRFTSITWASRTIAWQRCSRQGQDSRARSGGEVRQPPGRGGDRQIGIRGRAGFAVGLPAQAREPGAVESACRREEHRADGAGRQARSEGSSRPAASGDRKRRGRQDRRDRDRKAQDRRDGIRGGTAGHRSHAGLGSGRGLRLSRPRLSRSGRCAGRARCARAGRC